SVCGIPMQSAHTHEISSVFLYDMIDAFGGTKDFYQQFYINSPFPLAIVRKSKEGKFLNANYYDDKQLFANVKDFMIESLEKHISLGLDASEVFILVKNKANSIQSLKQDINHFDKLAVLE